MKKATFKWVKLCADRQEQERDDMSIYDIKMDAKGRIILPKQIRRMFKDGVRIVEKSDFEYSLIPLKKDDGIIVAKFTCNKSAEELLYDAWAHNVNVMTCSNGISAEEFIILAKGKKDDVNEFVKAHQTLNDVIYYDELQR